MSTKSKEELDMRSKALATQKRLCNILNELRELRDSEGGFHRGEFELVQSSIHRWMGRIADDDMIFWEPKF